MRYVTSLGSDCCLINIYFYTCPTSLTLMVHFLKTEGLYKLYLHIYVISPARSNPLESLFGFGFGFFSSTHGQKGICHFVCSSCVTDPDEKEEPSETGERSHSRW